MSSTGLRSRASSCIPPVHQRVYRMGLEHLGVVVGEEIDDLSRVHRAALTGRRLQSPDVRASLRAVRGLHPREVLPGAPSSTSSRTRKIASTASATSTTGCRSGSWAPPGRTRCRGDVRLPPGSSPPAGRASYRLSGSGSFRRRDPQLGDWRHSEPSLPLRERHRVGALSRLRPEGAPPPRRDHGDGAWSGWVTPRAGRSPESVLLQAEDEASDEDRPAAGQRCRRRSGTGPRLSHRAVRG